MTRVEIYDRIKAVLAELLTPADLSLVIDGAEEPLEKYLDKLCPMMVDEFYQTIPSRIISPISAQCIKIPADSVVLVPNTDHISTTAFVVGSVSDDSTTFSDPADFVGMEFGDYLLDGDVCKLTTTITINDKDYVSGYYLYNSDFNDVFPIINDASDVFTIITNNAKALLSISKESYCFSLQYEGENLNLSSIFPLSYAVDDTTVSLPYSLIEIEQMKYASWTHSPDVITIDDPAYIKQQNIYTRATYTKPVVALKKNNGSISQVDGITVDSRLYIAEVYSPKDVDDTLEICDIIVKTPFVSIPDDLIPAFCYLVASRYLSAIGNPKSESANKIFTEIVSRW